MKKLLFSLAIALASISSLSAQGLQSKLDEGKEAYAAKDFPKAAQALEAVIDGGMDDDSAASLVATAKTYLPQCYYMMGGKLVMSKDFQSARTNFTKAAEYAELYDDMATMMKATQWVAKTYEMEGGAPFNAKDYATALPIFESGYASDPRNAKMANWLGICYCETGAYDKGLPIFSKVAAMGNNPKYADEARQGQANLSNYVNNMVANLQKENDNDGIIKVSDAILANTTSPVLAKARLQAYNNKKEYAKVVELADAAASMQTSADEKCNIYFILGAAYNAQEMKPQAIAAFNKVTSGPNAEVAKTTVAELSK